MNKDIYTRDLDFFLSYENGNQRIIINLFANFNIPFYHEIGYDGFLKVIFQNIASRRLY